MILALTLFQIILGTHFASDSIGTTHCRPSASLDVIQSGSTIHILAKVPMTASVTIWNIIGVPVVEFRPFYFSKGKNRIDLQRLNLSPGIYILVLTSDSVKVIKRIIIHP